MDAFTHAARGEEDWSEPLRRYRVRTVVVPPTSGLAGVLRVNAQWEQVFGDDQAVIFTRR
jgi:hypothetical protein